VIKNHRMQVIIQMICFEIVKVRLIFQMFIQTFYKDFKIILRYLLMHKIMKEPRRNLWRCKYFNSRIL